MTRPILFTPLTMRGITSANRCLLSPNAQKMAPMAAEPDPEKLFHSTHHSPGEARLEA